MPIDVLKKKDGTANSEKNRSESLKKECDKYWRWGIIVGLVGIIFFFIVFLLSINTPTGSQDMGLDGYTQEELNKMYPQIKNADVPTRTTPEQTYAALKEALKNEDVDAAANCFIEEKRKEWINNFKQAKEENFIKQLAVDLPEKINEVYTYEAISQYKAPQIVDGHKTSHTFNFIKDSNGDWKIKSL